MYRPDGPAETRSVGEVEFVQGLAAASATANAEGDVARGEKRFEDCVACHSTERGVNNVGPSLFGVLGRKAGEFVAGEANQDQVVAAITGASGNGDKQ